MEGKKTERNHKIHIELLKDREQTSRILETLNISEIIRYRWNSEACSWEIGVVHERERTTVYSFKTWNCWCEGRLVWRAGTGQTSQPSLQGTSVQGPNRNSWSSFCCVGERATVIDVAFSKTLWLAKPSISYSEGGCVNTIGRSLTTCTRWLLTFRLGKVDLHQADIEKFILSTQQYHGSSLI